MSFFDDAISTVGRGLAQTAVASLSDASGFDVGGVMNTLFGNGQSMGGETLTKLASDLPSSSFSGKELAVLTDGITQQTQMISDIGGQISALAVDISSIKAGISDLQAEIAKIGQEATYSQWQTVQTALIPFIAQIQTSYITYGEYIANAATTKSTAAVQLATDILNTNIGPRDASLTINGYVLDSDGARGVLQLWSNMTAGLVAVGTMDYRDAVARYTRYYKMLAYTQLQATNLLMEAYIFNGDQNEAKNVWEQYRGFLLAQEDVFIRWLFPLVTAAIRGHHYRYSFGVYDAVNQLNPSIQCLPAYPPQKSGTPPAVFGFYAPSAVFEDAEQFLASLYVTDPADRRLVVHMMYDFTTKNPSENATITLASQSGKPSIAPSRTSSSPYTAVISGQDAGPDLTYYSGQFYCKRYVFENGIDPGVLIDDVYTLNNVNGVPPTIDVMTYYSAQEGSSLAQFMDIGPLSYQMVINIETPFAFVNFTSYVIPQYSVSIR